MDNKRYKLLDTNSTKCVVMSDDSIQSLLKQFCDFIDTPVEEEDYNGEPELECCEEYPREEWAERLKTGMLFISCAMNFHTIVLVDSNDYADVKDNEGWEKVLWSILDKKKRNA